MSHDIIAPEVRVWLKSPHAVMPTRADGSVGYDLYAPFDMPVTTVDSFMPTVIDLGIVIVPAPGYHVRILSKSGLAAKFGFRVVNSPGLIDPNYVGPDDTITAIVESSLPYIVHPGSRVAQFVIEKNEVHELRQIFDLPEAPNRGGLGSTGV